MAEPAPPAGLLDLQETESSAVDQPGAKPKKPPPKPVETRKHVFPPDGFKRFYDQYPRHVKRHEAEKAFAKIEASDTVALETIMSGLETYKRTKPAYADWAHPTSWLNGRRWLDEPDGAATAALASSSTSSPVIDFGNGTRAPLDTVKRCFERNSWPTDWGPPPGRPGCLVPADLQARLTEKAAA